MEREYLSREPKQYTRKEKIINWFDYNKWWVLIGIVAVILLITQITQMVDNHRNRSDIQFAYLSTSILDNETVEAFVTEMEKIAPDANGDGRVIVELNQYIYNGEIIDYAQNQNIEARLAGDLQLGKNFFLLSDNPEEFQRVYQFYAFLDGSMPNESDYSIDGKVIPLMDCPVVAETDFGTYVKSNSRGSVTLDNNEILGRLYLGRRCTYNDTTVKYQQTCFEFWDELTQGATE